MGDNNEDCNIDITKLLQSGKRSFIYECNKRQLIALALQLPLEIPENPTVEQLRKDLSEYLKTNSATKENLSSEPSTAEVKHTNKPSAKMAGDLKQFDGNNWEAFEKQLECIIILNDIKEEKKVPLLITKLSTSVFDNLMNVCQPISPLKKTYAELCQLLRQNYTQTQSTTINRWEFRRRNQIQGETIEDYVKELRKLARVCKFTDTEDQVKKKFIEGVASNLIKFELIKNSELTLDKVIILAKGVEAAIKTSNTTDSSQNPGTVASMFQNVTQRSKSFNRNKEQRPRNMPSNSEKKCFCCGKNNHVRAECSLIRKYCSECGRQGHIFRMCPNRKTHKATNIVSLEEPQQDQLVEKDDEGENLSSLFEEYEVFSLGVSKIPPHYVTLQIDEQEVEFQLDTGSDVTVMPIQYVTKHFPSKEIKKCKTIFKNFDQSYSEPIGIIENLTVKHNNTVANLKTFVGNNNMPCILGRDWLYQLSLWPPKLVGEKINHSTFIMQKEVIMISPMFQTQNGT